MASTFPWQIEPSTRVKQKTYQFSRKMISLRSQNPGGFYTPARACPRTCPETPPFLPPVWPLSRARTSEKIHPRLTVDLCGCVLTQ